jgi:hypothetical protein
VQYVALVTAGVLSLALIILAGLVVHLVSKSAPHRVAATLAALAGLMGIVPTIIYAVSSFR